VDIIKDGLDFFYTPSERGTNTSKSESDDEGDLEDLRFY
jgi:hypothetical protein